MSHPSETSSGVKASDAALSKQIFNIEVTEIEAIVESDSIAGDIGRKSMALIYADLPIPVNTAT